MVEADTFSEVWPKRLRNILGQVLLLDHFYCFLLLSLLPLHKYHFHKTMVQQVSLNTV